jgi:hypothetical protein
MGRRGRHFTCFPFFFTKDTKHIRLVEHPKAPLWMRQMLFLKIKPRLASAKDKRFLPWKIGVVTEKFDQTSFLRV